VSIFASRTVGFLRPRPLEDWTLPADAPPVRGGETRCVNVTHQSRSGDPALAVVLVGSLSGFSGMTLDSAVTRVVGLPFRSFAGQDDGRRWRGNLRRVRHDDEHHAGLAGPLGRPRRRRDVSTPRPRHSEAEIFEP